MFQKIFIDFPANSLPLQDGQEVPCVLPSADEHMVANRLNGVSTVDFNLTTKYSQACPSCCGPRRMRNAVDTENARQTTGLMKELGVRRILFTCGDPLQQSDAVALTKCAREIGLELRPFPGDRGL